LFERRFSSVLRQGVAWTFQANDFETGEIFDNSVLQSTSTCADNSQHSSLMRDVRTQEFFPPRNATQLQPFLFFAVLKLERFVSR
jgi:hypothetical protein